MSSEWDRRVPAEPPFITCLPVSPVPTSSPPPPPSPAPRPSPVPRTSPEVPARATDGQVSLRVLHTPGHSPGSVVLVVSAGGAERLILTADTLFPGSCGRLDLPGSSVDDMYGRPYRRPFPRDARVAVCASAADPSDPLDPSNLFPHPAFPATVPNEVGDPCHCIPRLVQGRCGS